MVPCGPFRAAERPQKPRDFLIGRFAPTPSGELHFGSLVGALGSYLNVKAKGGLWRLRIDDLDTNRCPPGFADKILWTLEGYGLAHDGAVIYQSERKEEYRSALDALNQKSLLFPCSCSRKQIKQTCRFGVEGPIYPGTCRNSSFHAGSQGQSIRIKTNQTLVSWTDQQYGSQQANLQQEYGDFVVWALDDQASYHLATVVDEQLDSITEVVRGKDLLNSTFRQVFLAQSLGYQSPQFLHLPLVFNEEGNKLSKHTKAPPLPLDPSQVREQIRKALSALGQGPPEALNFDSAQSLLKWAIEHWNPMTVPQQA